MPSRRFHDNIRFITSITVLARRHIGLDEATIRREALAVATKAIERHVEDQVEQESAHAMIGHAVDRAIEETR